jgi:hypothetical protein
MATATENDTAEGTEATDDGTRPRFRGCVFCYSAQLLAHGVRKIRR